MDLTSLDSTSRFAAPSRALSRSPSRSPSRRQQSHVLDPLLSNLSPTSTLEALEATQAVGSSGNAQSDILRDSVAAATTAERALGIRAALAAQKTREWYKEIKAWPWPTIDEDRNGFDLPPRRDSSSFLEKDGCLKRSDEIPVKIGSLDARDITEEEVYWGSLPADFVQGCECRIEEISDDMDMLQLDELKDYVRDVHLTTGFRRSSLQASEQNSGHVASYNHLGDFTAVITATIMQALPTITQLYLLLDTWSVRLTILRQVPRFLGSLKESQMAIKSGWNVIGKSEAATDTSEPEVSRDAFNTMRNVLEARISDLGRRLDNMLDMLEDREDVLPETWVDSMDNIEAEFGTWVMETETQVLDNELRKKRPKKVIEGSETNHTHNADIQSTMQERHDSHEKGDHGLIEGYPIRETDHKPGPGSPFSRSARLIPAAPQRLRPLDQSELKSIEPDARAQDPSTRSLNSHADSSLARLPGGGSSADPHPTESPTASVGSVYNLLSGLLGHEIADNPSANSGSQTDHQSPTEAISDVHPFQVPSQRKPKVASSRESLSQEMSLTNNKSKSSKVPENLSITAERSHSLEKVDREVGLVNESTLGQPAAEPLPVVGMEILDTLEAELLEQKHGPAARPGPLVFHKSHSRAVSNVSSDMSADTSYPGSATSEYFSNMSSPEIRDASRAEYFTGPVEVTTPSSSSKDPLNPGNNVSRQSSQRTERGDNEATEGFLPSSYMTPTAQRSRASTVKRDLGANDAVGFGDSFFPSPGHSESDPRARSASDLSTEDKLKDPVLNDTISQSESYLHASPGHWSHEIQYSGPSQPLTPALLRLQNEELVDTASFNHSKPFQLKRVSELGSESQSKKGSKDPGDQLAVGSPPPIPPKSRHRFENVSDLGPGSTPIKVRQRNRADPQDTNLGTPKSAVQPSDRAPVKSSEDQLEARISSILTDIPARIRLTSGPEADAHEVGGSGGPKDPQTPTTGSPAVRLLRSQSSVSSPPMTLAPAHPKTPHTRTQNGDSEIRLYHLHQSGKAAPIKLYVRLVGENGERVMVRIGGGWADLGEYLKEYATHHGRRSVSDGRFEIQGLPRSQSSSPATTLTAHPSSHEKPRSRPSSPSLFGSRNRRLSELASSDFGSPMTPEFPHTRRDSMTRSRDSSPASMRPSSRQSWMEDDPSLGLAGPRSKKVEMSPRKQAWVDDMVDQARNTSAEKHKAGEGDFGDLGKVGGTKRVFMKTK